MNLVTLPLFFVFTSHEYAQNAQAEYLRHCTTRYYTYLVSRNLLLAYAIIFCYGEDFQIDAECLPFIAAEKSRSQSASV